MSKLTLFQTNSPYDNDINKGGKLTPNELDSNFLELKGDDIHTIDYENGELTITFNSGETLSTVLSENNITTEINGDKIIDFKAINNDILLITEDKTYSVNIEEFPIIKEISKLNEIVDGNYNVDTGILILTKSNGDKIKVKGFINYLEDGILNNVTLQDKLLIFTMKNGGIQSVDLSSLLSEINVDTFNFRNKVVRINQIKSSGKEPLRINEHLLITKDMTIEKKQMTVGQNNVPGANSLAVGIDNQITSSFSLAVGSRNTNKTDNTFTLGIENLIEQAGSTTTAEGSAAIGKQNIVNERQAIAIGLKNKVNIGGGYSLAAGTENETNAPSSQAFGIKSKTSSTADAAMAQGFNTIASGKYSHAQGGGTKALGESSSASGSLSIANWKDAHAEGYKTLAEGHTAHSEGLETKALETASHAEGQYTETRALASHVQGTRNLIDENAKYSFVGGSNNITDAELSFIFGENNTAEQGCSKNVYILGRNIAATTRDTLYINKLNANDLEQVRNFRKYFLQQDSNGTVYKIETNDVLEMLNGKFVIITNGEYVNYGEASYENKIVLKGSIDEYEVVIDNVENTHIVSGLYDPYIKHLYLTDNSGETIDIDFSDGDVPMLSVKVSTNNTLSGNGLPTNPLGISPNEQTGQYKPVIAIVDELPTTNLLPGDRYITDTQIITGGYLYDFHDIADVDFGNGWRVPARVDWDLLLNELEPNLADKNHNDPGVSGWRGAVAANALKAQSFGGQDTFNFSILPVQYINSDGSLATLDNTKFWSMTRVLGEWDVFTKRFKADEGRVFSEPVAPVNEKLSIRLVRDIIDDNTGTTTINGVTYNTVVMPDQKLWLASNLADTTIPYTVSPTSSAFSTVTVAAEWTGTTWIYQELKEGYSIVIINDVSGGKSIEYRIINGVLTVVDTDFMDISELEARVTTLETALAQEITDRENADTTLQTNIDTVQTNLDNEVTRATTAEGILQTNIDNETTARIDADTLLNDQLISGFTIETDGSGELTGNLILVKNDTAQNITIPISNFFDFGNDL